MGTKIEWADITLNPVIGCKKISDGCKNCYAEKMASRLSKIKKTERYKHVVSDGKWNGLTSYQFEGVFEKVYYKKKPTIYFISSMGDLFYEDVSFWWIDEIFEHIKKCGQHIFIILTKRPQRMSAYFSRRSTITPLKNVWLGVTAENQETANKRIPILLQIPAAKRLVSVEPMLSKIDLSLWMISGYEEPPYNDIIDWVICGGESGPGARPVHPLWVENLRDQCIKYNVPFFFKQWGEYYTRWVYMPTGGPVFKYYESYLQFTQKLWVGPKDKCIDMDGKILKCGGDFKTAKYPVAIMTKGKKKENGCCIDGKEWKQYPEIN